MNKLTIEEQYLTLSQSKELQDLGIDFNNANAWFCKCTRNWQGNGISQPAWRLVHSMRAVVQGFEKFEYVPTLSVAEMLEMLPKCIEVKDVLYELYFKKSSFYINEIAYELGYREYLNESLSINEFTHTLLRDALFEMLKWLKQNKLI